jgi:enoyl-CoA hydratase/carnithine racemase
MDFENSHATLTVAPNGVGTLTIRDAGSLNILGTPVIEDLIAALDHAARTPAVRVLIMRGEGDKAFVAGADIKEMVALDQDSAAVFIEKLRQLCDGVRLLSVPVIARIPGWTLGGGLEFALACDLRIGSTAARLGMPEVQVGIPSIIHAALMPRLIGKARTNWMLLTGEVADAEQALAWGLLDRVVEPAELDAEIARVAEGLASLGTQVLAQQKRLLREWEDEPVETSIRNGVREFAQAFTTGEPQRYMGKFVEEKARRAAAK